MIDENRLIHSFIDRLCIKLEIPKRERLEKLRRKLGGLIEMANKKESIPDPRYFDPKRDRFWAEKYKQTPNFDHKDWTVEKKKNG